MNNYIALTKVLLKTGMNMGSMNTGRKKNGQLKKSMSSTAGLIISFVVAVPVALSMGIAGFGLYGSFAASTNVQGGYELLANMGALMVLVFSVPYVLSVFFLSSDLAALLPLPLKPREILAAKFTSVLIYEYLIIAMFYAPMLIGYGIAAAEGVLFWVNAVLSIVLVPVTPLCYASLIAILMMHLLKNIKNKEMIVTIGTFLIMFVIMGFSMALGGFSGSSVQGEAAMSALADQAGTISKIGVIFPNSRLLAAALADSDWLMMLLFVLSAAAFLAVFLFLGEILYFKSVKGMKETSVKKSKVISQADMMARLKASSPKKAIFQKELKTLLRSPEYFTNCLMMPILMPPIMLLSMGIPIFASMKAAGEASDFNALAEMLAQVPGELVMPIVLLVVYGFAILIAGSNLVTVTCLSREGEGFLYMKNIPISYRSQLEAKSWCGLAIGLLSSVPYVLAISILAAVLFQITPVIVLLALAVDFFTMFLCNYLQLLVDVSSPKLHWENEQGAVRQNYNTAISMLGIWLLGGAIGAGAVFLYKLLPIPGTATVCLILGILALLALACRWAVLSYCQSKMGRLEP